MPGSRFEQSRPMATSRGPVFNPFSWAFPQMAAMAHGSTARYTAIIFIRHAAGLTYAQFMPVWASISAGHHMTLDSCGPTSCQSHAPGAALPDCTSLWERQKVFQEWTFAHDSVYTIIGSRHMEASGTPAKVLNAEGMCSPMYYLQGLSRLERLNSPSSKATLIFLVERYDHHHVIGRNPSDCVIRPFSMSIVFQKRSIKISLSCSSIC